MVRPVTENAMGKEFTKMLSKTIKSLLRRFDRKLVYVPKYTVWGADLTEDLSILIPGDQPICFDIGANFGQTIEMLKAHLRNSTIYFFEPSPLVFQKLLDQFGGDKNIRLFKIAMGPPLRTHG